MDESRHINVDRLAEDLEALALNAQCAELEPLMAAMKSLAQEPQSPACLQHLVEVFNGLGIRQGVVLTYAPYLKVIMSGHIDTLLSHDPYWNKDWSDHEQTPLHDHDHDHKHDHEH